LVHVRRRRVQIREVQLDLVLPCARTDVVSTLPSTSSTRTRIISTLPSTSSTRTRIIRTLSSTSCMAARPHLPCRIGCCMAARCLLHVNSRSVGRLQQKVARRDSTAATVLLAHRPCYMVQRPVRKRCELTALRATVLEDAPYGVRHAPCGMRQRHAPCTAHEQPERRTRALALSGSARPLVASR
jgi:hypothetical protein